MADQNTTLDSASILMECIRSTSHSRIIWTARFLEPFTEVRITCTRYHWGRRIEYLAPSLDALKALGCVSPMMQQKLALPPNKRKAGSASLDEDGDKFHLHRCPTKAHPNRVMLDRSHISETKAFSLPGMRELCAEDVAVLHLDEKLRHAQAIERPPASGRGMLRLVVNNDKKAPTPKASPKEHDRRNDRL